MGADSSNHPCSLQPCLACAGAPANRWQGLGNPLPFQAAISSPHQAASHLNDPLSSSCFFIFDARKSPKNLMKMQVLVPQRVEPTVSNTPGGADGGTTPSGKFSEHRQGQRLHLNQDAVDTRSPHFQILLQCLQLSFSSLNPPSPRLFSLPLPTTPLFPSQPTCSVSLGVSVTHITSFLFLHKL